MDTVPSFPQASLHWYDGMLLLPEHFRYAFWRLEVLQHYRALVIHPYSWGIRRLQFNTAALGVGIIELTELEAIFPDGTVVGYNARHDDSTPLQLDLRQASEQLQQRPQRLWAAVAAAEQSELQAGYRRYNLGEQHVLTYSEHGQEASTVLVLRPQIQLVLAETLPARLVGIPLGEIAWEHEGPTMTSYIPPLLNVELDSPLGNMLNHIIQRLREKAQQLVNRINNPQPGISELTISELKTYVACLCDHLPLLESLLGSNVAHPWTLFTVLAHIAGRVAALGTERIPPLFRQYQHTDLYASFDQLRRYILRMVAESALETYVKVPFHHEGNTFTTELKVQWQGSTFILTAHPRSGVEPRELRRWVESAVIGTESLHESMKVRRVLGAQRTEVDRIPNVVVPRGTVLYQLELDDECAIFGESLVVENNLREHSTASPVELNLYVKITV